MFHDMVVYWALLDPQQVSKPKHDMFHDMFVH